VALDWRRANPFAALGWLTQQSQIAGLAAVVFLSRIAHDVLPSTSVLYTMHRYGWDTRTVGLTMATFGALGIVFQSRLLGPIVARLGEPRSLQVGLVAGAASFAIYGLAPTALLYWTGIPFAVLWGLSTPSAQALMTQRTDPSEQGRLQGALAALQGIAGMIAPGLFTNVFAAAVGRYAAWGVPGAPFLLAAAFLAVSALVARRSVVAAPSPA
jgi:DHA1 family tetracycline resistance protein-like MFS transporter